MFKEDFVSRHQNVKHSPLCSFHLWIPWFYVPAELTRVHSRAQAQIQPSRSEVYCLPFCSSVLAFELPWPGTSPGQTPYKEGAQTAEAAFISGRVLCNRLHVVHNPAFSWIWSLLANWRWFPSVGMRWHLTCFLCLRTPHLWDHQASPWQPEPSRFLCVCCWSHGTTQRRKLSQVDLFLTLTVYL